MPRQLPQTAEHLSPCFLLVCLFELLSVLQLHLMTCKRVSGVGVRCQCHSQWLDNNANQRSDRQCYDPAATGQANEASWRHETATWNVRTLLHDGGGELLALALLQYNVDVACLHELRLPGCGSVDLRIPHPSDPEDSSTLVFWPAGWKWTSRCRHCRDAVLPDPAVEASLTPTRLRADRRRTHQSLHNNGLSTHKLCG